MTNEQIILKTRDFIESRLAGDSSGHDWLHIERVWKLAQTLAKAEGANPDIAQLGALLHDVADWKFYDGDDSEGPRQARQWLESLNAPEELTRQVCDIVAGVSYKGAGTETPMTTLEGKVVQDADRLDAIGAIGIARAFAYGGAHDRLIFDPAEAPQMHSNFEEYKKNKGHTINHFHEKLLLLKDRMLTETGTRMAAERHRFMEIYLEQFHEEWDGQR
ncbi:MAG: HD domain-containing protein [Candidatus Nitrohelix vancouverensis]|uniref:HD domain-containing protein n=1 Tax=Candidatus Nitrohelix vancouverensis TaxID=2705534 RepID=A0A7T0G491_9BACT|nr:MAG: HD domain-containing protein [Candidatus Nitrohelix vancouverensis]